MRHTEIEKEIKNKPQKIQQREHGDGAEETLAHSLQEEKEVKEIEEQEHFLLKVSHKIKVGIYWREKSRKKGKQISGKI